MKFNIKKKKNGVLQLIGSKLDCQFSSFDNPDNLYSCNANK